MAKKERKERMKTRKNNNQNKKCLHGGERKPEIRDDTLTKDGGRDKRTRNERRPIKNITDYFITTVLKN